MSEDTQAGQQAGGQPGDASATSTAWRDVTAQLDSLGEAIGRWVKAAVNDPDNRERAGEVKDRVAEIVDKLGDVVDDAADSDLGQSFKDAADKTGDAFRQAGERVGEEVGPKVASALKDAAEKLRSAASRMEEKAAGTTAAAAESEKPDED